MKKIIVCLLAILLGCNMDTEARPATVIYYIMEQTSESVENDGYLSVTYQFKCERVIVPNVGALYPQPRMSITFTNHSDTEIIIDAEKSTLIRNSYKVALSSVASLQSELRIPPKGSRTVNDINVLSQDALHAIQNMYYYRTIPGKKKMGEFCFGYRSDLEIGSMKSYSENNTNLKLGSSIVYSTLQDPNQYEVQTLYFISKEIGTRVRGMVVLKEATDIVSNTFPDWELEKYRVINLWCPMGVNDK